MSSFLVNKSNSRWLVRLLLQDKEGFCWYWNAQGTWFLQWRCARCIMTNDRLVYLIFLTIGVMFITNKNQSWSSNYLSAGQWLGWEPTRLLILTHFDNHRSEAFNYYISWAIVSWGFIITQQPPSPLPKPTPVSTTNDQTQPAKIYACKITLFETLSRLAAGDADDSYLHCISQETLHNKLEKGIALVWRWARNQEQEGPEGKTKPATGIQAVTCC